MAGPSHQHAKSLRTVLSASARFRSDRPVKQQLRHRPAFAERDIGDMTPHSRGAFLRPGDASSRPLEARGHRECRCTNAPAASCANKKAHELVTTGTPKHPAFPVRWSCGLYALSSVYRAC